MSEVSCTGCWRLLLTDYGRCFERALAELGDEHRLVFHACHSYEAGDNQETHDAYSEAGCLRVLIVCKDNEVKVAMRSFCGDIDVECSCSATELEELVEKMGSHRTRLALRRLIHSAEHVSATPLLGH